MPKKALIILAPGYEEVEAMTPIDLLRRVGIEVVIAGLGSREITGAHGITIKTDVILDAFDDSVHAIILPGGGPGTKNLMESEKVLEIVRSCFNDSLLCAAICAAPQVLYKAGILEGKNFTCFPGVEKKILHGTFSTESVVQDGNIITSRGVGTAIPFALKIVEYLLGKTESEALATKIVF